MDVYINKTRRAIAIGGVLLVPGKKCQLKDVDKLKRLYPRFAELLEKGDIVEATKADTEPVRTPVNEKKGPAVEGTTEEPKAVSRRKRV